MISIVIGQQQRLAQNRLAVSMRNRRAPNRFSAFYQLDHFLEIVLERLHALSHAASSGGKGVSASSPREIPAKRALRRA